MPNLVAVWTRESERLQHEMMRQSHALLPANCQQERLISLNRPAPDKFLLRQRDKTLAVTDDSFLAPEPPGVAHLVVVFISNYVAPVTHLSSKYGLSGS